MAAAEQAADAAISRAIRARNRGGLETASRSEWPIRHFRNGLRARAVIPCPSARVAGVVPVGSTRRTPQPTPRPRGGALDFDGRHASHLFPQVALTAYAMTRTVPASP